MKHYGNPRNKVALQPGHSLMDWIRLGTSGKDLTGLGSRGGNLSVTKLELARHNTMTDAWTAIRGRVYNITEYLAFHPGGEDELMRGAGIDATGLFEEVPSTCLHQHHITSDQDFNIEGEELLMTLINDVHFLIPMKHDSGVWDNYGVLKQQTKLNSTSSSQVRSTYLVKRKSDVNYNTVLLQLEREDEGRIVVPVGRHVRVFAAVDGEEFSRSYTPVPDNLFDKFLPHCKKNYSLCLMVKRYSNGKMSRYITDKDMNDYFSLSRPFGGMELKTIEKRETFLMLAGGTGITPMLSLILFLLERRIKKCQFIRLLFFNRTEKDILFKTQLASLAASDQRLKINNILSEPNETWTGEKGHVNSQLIQDCLEEHLKDTGYTIKDIFVFICGPPKFNDAALQQLHDLSMSSEQIKKFEG
ncbi:hypothetical protein GWI33_008693 [Rhynchophorus ferrugineus]|uniref:cytochrome-b5 reductase n=1 Tax=Rhynchophorus ferrugineus TaxID=354439 RepID=A0A834ICK4_RHYFE|nr:hypothetical protein GWI33_008693 [Rhynchophorus ferrugineus]